MIANMIKPPRRPNMADFETANDYIVSLENYADHVSGWIKKVMPEYIKYHESLSEPDRIATIVLSILNRELGEQYTLQQVKQKRRFLEFIIRRQAIMYYLRMYTNLTLKQIGDYFYSMDHSTVIHGVREWTNRIECYKQFKRVDTKIRKAIED